MSDLDPAIHQPIRLRIMAALVAIAPGAAMPFMDLKDLTSASSGNLGAHLARLEEGGYVRIDKRFVRRKPRTTVAATPFGRKAFERHVEALKSILEG